MVDWFPPVASIGNADTVELIRATFRSVLEPRTSVYAAGPVTGGRRLLRWWSEAGSQLRETDMAEFERQRQACVIRPNIEEGLEKAQRARRRLGRLVIEPFTLNPAGWTQDDYRHLWGEVIREFADTVVLFEDWEFSDGGAYEFWIAATLGLTVLREDLLPLSIDHAMRDMRMAIDARTEVGLPSNFSKAVLDALNARQAG